MLIELLGLRDQPTSGLDWHDVISAGFTPSSIRALAKALRVSPEDVCDLIGVNPSILSKTGKAQRLSLHESNFLYRIAVAFHRLMVPLKKETACVSWLRNPQPMLKGRIPVLLLSTHIGTEYVYTAIARIPEEKVVAPASQAPDADEEEDLVD